MINNQLSYFTIRFYSTVIRVLILFAFTMVTLLGSFSLHLHRLPDGQVVVHSHSNQLNGKDQSNQNQTGHDHSNTEFLGFSQSTVLCNETELDLFSGIIYPDPSLLKQYKSIPVRLLFLYSCTSHRAPPQTY